MRCAGSEALLDDDRGAGVLCRLCQAGGVLRRSMEGGLSVTCPWGGEKLFCGCDPIRKPAAVICRCNDGLRPVIFKLKASGGKSWHKTPFSKKFSRAGSKTMRKTNQEKEDR